jgi:oligopeptide transport system ATP-binding protein
VPLFQIEDLVVDISGTQVLRGISVEVDAGQTLGVVGESGCGKSMTGLAAMGMLPRTARILSGSIRLEGRDLTGIKPKEWLDIRGQDMAMVMQDPFTSLNPVMRIGDQIAEVLTMHHAAGKKEARRKAVEMLEHVGVPDPERSARKFPHQMSGGQRQRVVIAIAFIARPKVLIADEPTTALDVTLQAQILSLLRDLQQEEDTAVILISHDIGVIGAMADEIAVYYAGRVVEKGTAEQVLRTPKHPYTEALLQAMPEIGATRLESISGQPPDLSELTKACAFAPRCRHRMERCELEPNLLWDRQGHGSACWLAEEGATENVSRSEDASKPNAQD